MGGRRGAAPPNGNDFHSLIAVVRQRCASGNDRLLQQAQNAAGLSDTHFRNRVGARLRVGNCVDTKLIGIPRSAKVGHIPVAEDDSYAVDIV